MGAPVEGGAAGLPQTLGGLLAAVRRLLADGGVAGADFDARLLVSGALGLDAAAVFLRADELVEPEREIAVRAFAARRVAGEPVHRILGRRAFYNHEFALSPETLEPRPDTEILVDLARPCIERVIAAKGQCRMVDVGTGTGAIAVTLLALYPGLCAVAVDIVPGALATAARNAASASVSARFLAVASDYLSALNGPFDLIVSNPPYIPSVDIAALDRSVRDFDPRLALDGGPDGLDAYRRLAQEAGSRLATDGRVLVEIGQGQASDVADVFRRYGLVLAAWADDLGGIRRALHFERAS